MTLFFSCSTPNLATVIPAMDHIDAHFTTASQNSKYSPSICASLALGKAHLNRYYNMTNYSEVYWIAMSKCSSTQLFDSITTLLQSYIHDTNFNISVRPTGMTHGSLPWPRLSVMSLCEHMQTSLSMRLLLFVRRMYVLPISTSTLTNIAFFRLPSQWSITSLMIYHQSQPLSPPSSRMSSNNTLSALSKMSRMHSHGGSGTERSTPVCLGWH